MLKEKLGVDDKDIRIIAAFMKDPDVSQAELARSLHLSQPSINQRVQKLKRAGLLVHNVGIEFSKANTYMVRVDFTAKNASAILDYLKACSFFVNGFLLSGKNNVSILIIGHDLKKVETIINTHLRINPDVQDITTSVVVGCAKPFVFSVDIEHEQHDACQNKDSCETCPKLTRHQLKAR